MLKNKKTGEIANAMEVDLYTDVVYLRISKDGRYDSREYSSLAELNAEWGDYEEPKENWTIDPINENCVDDGRYTTADELERYEELGLKFETKEEAEKAAERLRAWKRLKDKGFRFTGKNYDSADGVHAVGCTWDKDIPIDDYDLLFSQEDS